MTSSVTTHTYDFSETDIKFYSSDTAISTASLRTNMIFDGNTLSCKPGKTFSFGSAGFLGDDYGIYGGKASFRFEISGGELSAGVRLSKKSADNDHRGIWFSFDNEKITVSEPESGLSVTVSEAVRSGTAVIEDKADVIELYVNGELVCGVLYDAYNGAVSVSDPQGKTLAEKGSTSVRPAGCFTVYADGLTICSKDDATDIPYISLGEKSETLALASEKITDIVYNGNKTLMNNQIIEAFSEGRALFLAEITGYLDVFRSMEDNFGIVPYPKLSSSQERYCTTNSSCIMVFSIPAFSYKQNELERSSIIFEGLNSESYKLIRPAYYIDVLKGKQTRDYRDYEMLDLIRNSRVYDFGLFNDLGKLTGIFASLASTKNPKVSSLLKKSITAGEKKLNGILEKYQSIS